MTTSRMTPTPWVEMPDNTESDGASRRTNLIALATPDPEVLAKPSRRRFTADDKSRILGEIEACTESGQVGAILRREGLYSSLIATWRRQREIGHLMHPPRRGRERTHPPPDVSALQKENNRLQRELARAETIIDVLKKVSALLEIPVSRDKNV